MRELRLTPVFIAKHHNLEDSFNENFVWALHFNILLKLETF